MNPKELPHDLESRIKTITEHLKIEKNEIPLSFVEELAKCWKIWFITKSPVFDFLDKNVFSIRNYVCFTYYYDIGDFFGFLKILNDNPNVFALYSVDTERFEIRGSFIHGTSDYISKRRNKIIEDVLNQ